MNAIDNALPAGFAALEPFVCSWAVEGANNRLLARLNSCESDRSNFFEAAKALLAPGLEYLDTKPFADFNDQDKRLMNLLLSLAHVALAVETQGSDEPMHAAGARYITITRAPSDQKPVP